ncbi:MAG TPA: DNA polymerase III subunit gamma/tau [Thermoanaerobaculia bacterium]|nr:DNA polymerase III subunit gamma/tau [Thermoanaerobaculia bacterium]
MSYQALARKYRPQTFSDIVGQETSVQTLKNAIRDQRIHHAYLFAGVRGVGKTTSARILAKALNCVSGPTTEPDNTCVICREITEGIDMDVREIDAATYTGVDNVRELRDVTQFQPARDRYRIFIIDEAHMLSVASWNALLKLIEEPPPHVIFMFATTEMNKVPQTIISRVQRIQLRKLTLEEIEGRLRTICKAEGIEAEREALAIVARRGEGSVRDALSLLDQVIAFAGRSITAADVATVLGLSETTFFARVVSLIGEGDHAGILEALNDASANGRDFKLLYRDLLNFVRNLLLLVGGANESMLSLSPEDLAVVREAAKQFSYTELLRIANLLLRDDETVNKAEHQRLAVEIALLKAATFPRLRAVEEALGSSPAPQPRAATPKPASGSSTNAFLDRVKKARPGTAAFLADASIALSDNVLRISLQDSFAGERVRDAQPLLDEIARELFGAKVEITVEEKSTEAAAKAPPAREDPLVKAFQKHLGAELVEPRKR